jgi:streptomycin 6-kinase
MADEKDKIRDDRVESYYESVKEGIAEYITRWKLSKMRLLDDGRESFVCSCHSEIYGDAILKNRKTAKVIEDEYNTLAEYRGRRFCKAFDADIKNGFLLEEQIQPGLELRKEKSLDKRLFVFCLLHNGLHIMPSKADKYPTYLDWVSKITGYMEKREDYKDLYLHMKRANDLCGELFAAYPSRMLLHGDLHHDNILLNERKEYTIIDPKGVLGDPIFDIPRFILNEMEENLNQQLFDKINYMIKVIGTRLNIPVPVLKQCFYIEMAMAECWNVEDQDTVCLDNVIFAEKILKS